MNVIFASKPCRLMMLSRSLQAAIRDTRSAMAIARDLRNAGGKATSRSGCRE